MTNEEKEQARMENENYDPLLSLKRDNGWYGAKRNLFY